MLTGCKSEVDNQVEDIITVDPYTITMVLLVVSRHGFNNQPRKLMALSFTRSILEYNESSNLP